MSNIKTYRITAVHCDDAEVTLQVDHDVLTPELAGEINKFWGGSEWRLGAVGGDPVKAVIRLFGCGVITYMLGDGGADLVTHNDETREYWTQKVIDADGEGWPDCKDLGILILSAAVNAVGYDEVSLEAVV